MPGVFLCKSFAGEHMSQMTFAVTANNLGATSIGIPYTFHSTGNFVVETRPAAVRFKFIFGSVQRRIALTAHISTAGFVVDIFACKSTFGTLVKNNRSFLFRQLIVFHCLSIGLLRAGSLRQQYQQARQY